MICYHKCSLRSSDHLVAQALNYITLFGCWLLSRSLSRTYEYNAAMNLSQTFININVLQQIIVETLINTSANHPSKHCQQTKTIAVQFDIWRKIRTTMHNRHGFHEHRTSRDPESLVDEKIDDKDFLVLYFKHATIKLYLTLSHVGWSPIAPSRQLHGYQA
mgnify:CR=1 FL=1